MNPCDACEAPLYCPTWTCATCRDRLDALLSSHQWRTMARTREGPSKGESLLSWVQDQRRLMILFQNYPTDL